MNGWNIKSEAGIGESICIGLIQYKITEIRRAFLEFYDMDAEVFEAP